MLRNLLIAIMSIAAHAAHAEEFGDAHVLALSSDANVSSHYVSVSPGDASSTTFVLVPALDWFVAERLSLGGFALVSTTSTSTAMMDSSATALGIGPRVGYAVPLGSRFTLWPKLGVSWVHASVGDASD